MSDIEKKPVDPVISRVFSAFFEGSPAVAEIIDTSRGEEDFRNTVIVTTDGGEKYVLKFAANDFTFPEKIRMWQRTVEEYLDIGCYCPRIIGDKNGDFPIADYKGRRCAVYAEEFSRYKPLSERTSGGGEEADIDDSAYFDEVWSMTARIAAKKLDYTDHPSAYCLFETFCPSDETDEVMENALEWKAAAEALPEEFSVKTQRIWRLWNENREMLKELYPKLPTSVFQADLNPTNLLIDEDGSFRGVYDFNLCGKDVFLNYLMRENSVETIPKALKTASKYYAFSEEEKAAALPLFRCLKPLWYNRVSDLKKAGDDPEEILRCLDRSEYYLNWDFDLRSCME